MASLIARQEATLARMAEQRSSERRAAANRSAAIGQYHAAVVAAGYSKAEAAQQVHDLWDMYRLRQQAE